MIGFVLPRRARFASASGFALAAALAAPGFAQSEAQSGPVFTDAQAEAGAVAYAQNCAVCHGADAGGGPFGPPLRGAAFLARWGGAPLSELFAYTKASMPPVAIEPLDDETYAAILAFQMRRNGVDPGAEPMAADPALLAAIAIPDAPPPDMSAFAAMGIGGVSDRAPVPDWPAPPDRFADYAPVTQDMLSDPAPENWLAWRRGHRAQGFSPLDQITTDNVGGLRAAWSLALPAGPNMNEPLVRDGVLYVFGFGDEVFALDAAIGAVLWRYQRHLPDHAIPSSKKTMALYGDKLFVGTSDMHLVALDARTGRPAWDRRITDRPGFRNPGGPLAADGVVMQGLTTQGAGGALIAGFDAETGEHLWTFNTVAQPDEPGGDTWNDLPAEARSGGSVWTSGSYDAETGVALFGPAPTYDTGPLRDPAPGHSNDALYTDATIALAPRTGALVWHYQHMKNDQWDLDWAFERVIGEIAVNGEMRRVIITSGKEGLFDVLDADTGAYLHTVDMGLQNFVTHIDPETGEKTVDPALVPGGGQTETITVCPHGGGGRNWIPTGFNPDAAAIFVVARDVCMDMNPTGDGTGFLTTGVVLETVPRPDSDGRYGLLQALDVQAREILWEHRQRAPYTTGVLTTAGGLLFAGSSDRQIMAYDQATGQVLWRHGLGNIPNAAPISFAVDGRQYIAVIDGAGNPLAGGLSTLTPEIGTPPVNSSAITVFALPED